MPDSKLPERASLEYLKKLAKERLQHLRREDPRAKLAAALLAVARDHGFASWRALKAEVERRRLSHAAFFFEACMKGDIETLRSLLSTDNSLALVANSDSPYGGWTGLHTAAQRGHIDVVQLLLQYGANPNAREAGDNTTPLHWAPTREKLEIVRLLLDAGSDVNGFGDVHELDVIGWATVFHAPDGSPGGNPSIVSLLLERGARHHIFSSIAVGDLDLIRTVVEQNLELLDRRMSRFEQGKFALHYALSLKRYDILAWLIELGADLEAEDNNGHTALAVAMLQADTEAMRLLNDAGAKQPQSVDSPGSDASLSKMASLTKKGVPMIRVLDIARTLDWYNSLGFTEVGRFAHDGVVDWGMVSFGRAEIMFMPGQPAGDGVRLWFYTAEVDPSYQFLKSRQLKAAHNALAGQENEMEKIEFAEHLYDPFYGGRQFSIRDLNGYTLIFYAED